MHHPFKLPGLTEGPLIGYIGCLPACKQQCTSWWCKSKIKWDLDDVNNQIFKCDRAGGDGAVDMTTTWRLRKSRSGLLLLVAIIVTFTGCGKSQDALKSYRPLKLEGIRQADLCRADLRHADLQLADVSGADLREAKLSGANLILAHLTELTSHLRT